MVDNNLIQEKINYMENNLSKLEKLNKLPRETFLGEFYYVEAAKHLLQVTIEAMLDICQHVIARQRFRAPNSYADALNILIDEGILPESQKDAFLQMAKFRNRVVHLYNEVDSNELHRILHERLGDFRYFIQAVVKNLLTTGH